MTRKGMNLEKMAEKLGQSGPNRKDRVRKQRDLAIKLFSETAERIRRLGAAQQARNAVKATSPAMASDPPVSSSVPPLAPMGKKTKRKE
jgi:hypothetical protein